MAPDHTAASLTEPLSIADDTMPLASALRVLGVRSRLEALQMLMDGPRLTAQLPARHDELNMLQDVGVVTSVPEGRTWRWSLVPEALEKVADCLKG